jgi:hypothetical protein
MAVRVFEINDCEWWAGDCTPEEMLADYIKDTGCTHEQATGDTDTLPRELSDSEMDLLMFTDTDENERRTGEPRPFREQLAIEVAAGGTFPRLFACTEY